ncbi:MAG: hypothetical protein ACTSW1_03145 [Candidatus Hodarchaeales archaeon]
MIRLILFFLILLSPFIYLQPFKASKSDNSFEVDQYFPQSSIVSSDVLSKPLQIQNDVIAWLEQNIDITDLLETDFEKGIITTCEAIVSIDSTTSISNVSQFSTEIYELFYLLINNNLQTTNYTLNKSNSGLYYIWDGSTGIISTKINLCIAQALKYIDIDVIPNKIEIIQTIISTLNTTLNDDISPFLLREMISIDNNEAIIPGSLSPLATLEDQLRFLDVLQFLIPIINDTEKQGLIDILQVLEENILNGVIGFLNYSIPMSGLELGFLHSVIDQAEGYTYFKNVTHYSFKNAYLLFDYFAKQSFDFIDKDSASPLDFYDPDKAAEYQNLLLALLTDVQFLFKDEETGLFYSSLSYSNETGLVEFNDKLLILDQFSFINILSTTSQQLNEVEAQIEHTISPEQMQELYIELWLSLEDAYVETQREGTGSTILAYSTGYFYGFYSKNLGLFLYDNSTYGSLFLANILALTGLGTIFPFVLTVKYLNPLTTRDQQSLNITISPIVIKSGFLTQSDIYLKVTQENINTLISQVTLNSQYNTSIHYNYTILKEGTIQFSLELQAKQAIFFTLDSIYSVLKTLTIEAKLHPTSPIQKEQLTIVIEARDSVGIIKESVFYTVKIQSATLANPIWIINQSLFNLNGSEKPIILNSSQTDSNDLVLYIIATKTNYYPAELNVTIHFQTKLNFLFEWLSWFIFESEFGGYIGTISTLVAIVFAFYSRIVRRALGKVKSCPYCGAAWETKYSVCSHCGRELKPLPSKLRKAQDVDSHDTSRNDEDLV